MKTDKELFIEYSFWSDTHSEDFITETKFLQLLEFRDAEHKASQLEIVVRTDELAENTLKLPNEFSGNYLIKQVCRRLTEKQILKYDSEIIKEIYKLNIKAILVGR